MKTQHNNINNVMKALQKPPQTLFKEIRKESKYYPSRMPSIMYVFFVGW